ncbi:MAG: toll/interleukin-1 receptor domain-containing protein [Thermoguttaceae bacterium]|nr:toll/interleukin-1 receptor domain-containing protein [Thermoguttaceae bacterium]
MQDNLAYRYFAFISYSSKDKNIAEKIHDKIEAYPLPSVLRNELEAERGKDIPEYLSPLFLDISHLGAGQNLSETINQELKSSRFLLVICSPNSAKSDWVNQEVENFILMGRYDRIIPYIIKGIPNSGDPKTECLPPILRKKRVFISYSSLSNAENAKRHADLHNILDSIRDELKGASLSDEGADISLIKVIARMLEIRPDELVSLYHQQQKKKRNEKLPRILTIVLSFLILFTSLGLWTWIHYYKVHVGYFADYVEYWGVPRGIFPLTTEQRERRTEHYRIYTQNQRVIRLEHVNSAGTPVPVLNTELQDRPMIADYEYDKDGRLVQRKDLDNNGKVIMSNLYSGDKMQKVEFKSIGDDKTSSSTVLTSITSLSKPLQDTSMGKHGEIGNMRFERDDKGRVIEVHFQKGGSDVSTTDEQGIAGFQFILDDYGRIVERIYLGRDGAPCPDKQGVARRTTWYDDNGNLVGAKYFDTNGNLTFNELGWMHCTNIFDEFGNYIEEKFFDSSGALCLNNNGIAGWKCKYDEHGNAIEILMFDVDAKLCLCKDGYAKITRKYNNQGNIIDEKYSGIDGRPCLNQQGFARDTAKYDKRGNVTEVAFFDIDDKPCLHKDGNAKVAIKYDERGNQIEIAYYGIDDKLCLILDGLARYTIKYDERGNVIEMAYYGSDDKPCLHKDGNAIARWKYDERGNQIEEAFFGIDGQPCRINDNYSKATWKYDERGNVTEMAYYDIDDKPCLHKDGNAIVRWKYDKRGNRIEAAYFGIDGQPCQIDDGSAKCIYKYDKRGNEIEAAYFGIDGQPCRIKEGYSIITMKYDERGNKTENAYFDIDGQPCLNEDRIAKCIYKFDERGNQIEEIYYNTEYKPCLHKDGYFRAVGKYDERGHIIEAAAFDIDGLPCLHENGCARVTMKYDARGKQIEKRCFGIDGHPCQCNDGYAKCLNKYDERGNKIEEAYFGVDNNPCLSVEGIAGFKYQYDQRGNKIEVAYLGVDNNPCLSDEGIAGFKSQFDEKKREIHREFFGIDGKPCVLGGDDPYTGWEKSYYENGSIAKQTWFYTIKPCKGILGKWIQEYDERSKNVTAYYLDMNDNPCLDKDEIAGFKSQIDEKQQEIRREFFGIDGKPCVLGGDDPYTGWEITYYENGSRAKQTWFYTIKPYKNILGKWIVEFDESGNDTSAYYLDMDDKPRLHDSSYARITRKFDERGNKIEEAYFGVDNNPCLSDEEIAGFKSQYDEKNREVHREFFGVDGKACVLGGDDPYTGWEKSYYDNGSRAKQTWFYTIKPYKSILGKWIKEYDERGNNTSMYFLDKDDKPCLHDSGYARITRKFDDQGNKIEVAYFGVDNNPCLSDEGIAGFKSQFDEKQQEIRREFFGIDGKPCVLGGDDPYTGWEKTYYENGARAKQTWFYTIKPYKSILGKWIEEFDESGNNTLIYFLDMNDKPCLCNDGYARVEKQYDEQGIIIQKTYYDIDGKQVEPD